MTKMGKWLEANSDRRQKILQQNVAILNHNTFWCGSLDYNCPSKNTVAKYDL